MGSIRGCPVQVVKKRACGAVPSGVSYLAHKTRRLEKEEPRKEILATEVGCTARRHAELAPRRFCKSRMQRIEALGKERE